MDGLTENMSFIAQIPTELIILIFKRLSVKQLTKCRQVSKRWKQLIDFILSDDIVWERYCKYDFPTIYKEARTKSVNCTSWRELYCTLSQWDKLNSASESRDEFCYSTNFLNNIRGLLCLEGGIAAINRGTVVYYDVNTLSETRQPILDDIIKHAENEELCVYLNSQLQLHVFKKVQNDLELQTVYNNIKNFYYSGGKVYVVTLTNQIFSYDIGEAGDPFIYANEFPTGVISMSNLNNTLHILTTDKEIMVFKNEKFELQQIIDSSTNLMDVLWRHQFLEDIDWTTFFVWMAHARKSIMDGPLRYICTVKVYGDLFLVGCKCGVLRLYYKPYDNGQLDIFNSAPIKHYNFSERIDIPILSLHPVLQIEVLETKDGHIMLIATPRKIILIKYTNYVRDTCKALIPYNCWQNVVFNEEKAC